MKLTLLLALLVLCQSIDVKKADQCQCTALLVESDCRQNSTCSWTLTGTVGKCTLAPTTTTPGTPTSTSLIVSMCTSITAQTECAATLGCVYLNKACTFATGCSSYVFTTHKDCQAVSKSCNSNGTNCIDGKDCPAQKVQADCESMLTFSGSKYCKWDATTLCSDVTCTEAPDTNDTNEKCDAFLPGCITTGLGCYIQQTLSCTMFVGDATKCPKYKTADGPCIFDTTVTPNKCAVKTCKHAPISTTTDEACKAFKEGCITNGRGCVTALGACASYDGTDQATCQAYKATDGSCDFVTGATKCSLKDCSKASAEFNTDTQCIAYSKQCITNGKGCQSTPLAKCDTLTGDATFCNGRIGSDGKCAFKTGESKCSLKDCTTADATNTTDALCLAFSKQCVTNGKGCVPSPLGNCSTMAATSAANCDGKIGADGACKYEASAAFCSVKVCTDNTTSNTTNALCQAFSPQCRSTGTACISKELQQNCAQYTGTKAQCANMIGKEGTCKGVTANADTVSAACVKTTCEDLNKTSADDAGCADVKVTDGCKSNGKVCVTTLAACSTYTGTTAECDVYKDANGKCTGTNATTASACKSRTCSDAPDTLTTDDACNTYMTNCKTRGKGCVTALQPCASYKGTTTTCVGYIGSDSACKGISATDLTAACAPRECKDDTTSTTDAACNTFLAGCGLNLAKKGCAIKKACFQYSVAADCTSLPSTDTAGSCTWKDNACKAKVCSDAPSTSSNSDTGCEAFLTGCKTDGTICLAPDFACKDVKNKTKCTKDGKSQPCLWNTDKCISYKSCTDMALTTHADCQKFSGLCTTNGTTCAPLGICSKLPTNICVKGADGSCGATPTGTCQLFKACTDITTATSVAQCTAYNSGCTSDGTKCIPKDKCASYSKEATCVSGGTDGPCKFETDKCRLLTCADFKLTTHDACYASIASTKCTSGTADTCIPLAKCATYTKATNCMIGTDGTDGAQVNCKFELNTGSTTEGKCRVVQCSDYTEKSQTACAAKLAGCVSDGTACLSKGTCSQYTTEAACRIGGTDGNCYYSGTACIKMTKCEDASVDKTACAQYPKICQYKDATTTGATGTCIAQTCLTLQVGEVCEKVLSFDLSTSKICVLSETDKKCVDGDATLLKSNTCYSQSYFTYKWNTTTNKCEVCTGSGTTNPGTTDPGTTDGTDGTTTTSYGYIIAICLVTILAQ